MTKKDLINLAKEIIDNNKFAIVGNVNLRGYANVRALTKMKHDGFEKFYFSTRTESYKVKQMKIRPKGSIYFYHKDKYQSVMLEGKFVVEKNREFDVADLYKIDYDDPYDFSVITFITKNVYIYTNFKSFKFSVDELK